MAPTHRPIARAARRALLVIALLVPGLVWAPTGSATMPGANGRIYFRQGRNIYSVLDNGSGKQVEVKASEFAGRPRLMDVAVSPNGTKLAFATGGAIWTWNLETDKRKEVTKFASDDLNLSGFRYPTWSPTGKRLIFQAVRKQNGIFSQRLYRINVDGDVLLQLHKFSNMSMHGFPDWSIDNKVAFMVLKDLWLMDADGTNKKKLATLAGTTFEPSWSPNGEEIAVEHEEGGDVNSVPGIVAIDAENGNVRLVTGNGPSPSYEYSSPSWSPDGEWIAFDGVYNADDGYINDIYIVEKEGTNMLELNTSTANTQESEAPSWGDVPPG